MKIAWIIIAAALLGASFTYLVIQPAEAVAEPASAGKDEATAKVEGKLRALNQEIAQLKTRLAAGPGSPPPAAPAAAKAGEGAADVDQKTKAKEVMLAQRRTAMKQQVEDRVARITEKLGLDAGQAAAATAWHAAHQENLLAAGMKSPPDPRDYHLRMAYRQDLPPEVQATLTPEQQAAWTKYDADNRADSVESITNAEMGFIAGTLDLSRDQKDQIFPHLSELYMQDTYADFANVVDVPTLSSQKDADNERRRQFYGTVLDAKQMEKWESVAASYKDGMLQQYSTPKR